MDEDDNDRHATRPVEVRVYRVDPEGAEPQASPKAPVSTCAEMQPPLQYERDKGKKMSDLGPNLLK